MTTCLLTGLTTIGASRQKQILRLTGALVGGFVIGMGSQIFVLPYVDSIVGFTVIFIIVTAFSSWIITSSPRLSYFGVTGRFCLLSDQPAGVRVPDVTLHSPGPRRWHPMGLFAMWLVFDQLWGNSAGMEMKRAFISNLRLWLNCKRQPFEKDLKVGC